MATHPLWQEEYWVLLMQLYLKKPVGVKALYSKPLIDLSLELHIEPEFLYEQLFRIRRKDSPAMCRLWDTYGEHHSRLGRDAAKVRRMKGYGNAEGFYDGVAVNESFERDFRPLAQNPQLNPVMLIRILDLYFRLTPLTMVVATAEIQDEARLLRIPASLIVNVMEVFQFCDPYLNRGDLLIDPLLLPCKDIWKRYGNDNPERLSAVSAQLKEYFKS
ncbi:hypothetical protein [Prevotella sp.]|uniref:hypothetical protein n=1 Tax=Prevotella sp. TaxID=59823 RepID=UPI002F928155